MVESSSPDRISVANALRRGAARLSRLDTRIGLALGGLMLVLAIALAFALSKAAEQQILRLSTSNIEALSDQMARELADGMDRFGREAVLQSVRERFRSPDTTPAEMRETLEQFKRINPEYAWVAIVDAESARVLAATGGIFEGGNIRGRPVFDGGLMGPFVGDVHEAVKLGQLLPRPANGEPLRFLDASAPIQDPVGRVVRVFAAHISWQWTSDLRERIFGPLKARRGVEAFLVDTDGNVVLAGGPGIATGSSLAAMGRLVDQPAGKVRWADGRDYLTYVVATRPQGQFPGFGWKVVARQPYATAFGPVVALRNAFLAGAAALGLLAAALAWWVAARLVRPVRVLTEELERGEGECDTVPVGGGALHEVSVVRSALTRLSDQARGHAEATETSEQRFAVLAASLPQVVWQSDAAGLVDYVNKDWLLDLAPGRPLAVEDLGRLAVEEDRPMFIRAWAASLASGVELNLRCRVVAPGQHAPRWFDFKATSVRRGHGPARWIGTLFDVHEIVTLAEGMQRALAEEREARSELERLSRLRDEFLATVSHELRSPLSAITGWSDILARKGGDDPMVVQAAAVIRRNAQLQARLINDLLDMNAVTAGKMVLDNAPVDLSALAREVVLSHLHDAQRKGVELRCGERSPVVVEGDAKRLTQVLSNLVGNAIKFTDAGGRIEVVLGVQGGQAHVDVVDTGRGIAPEFLPRVFDRLRQEDASITRKVGGLGLGLAISKALVELHGGGIAVRSDGAGLGCTFTVTLPLAEGAQGGGELLPRGEARGDAEAAADLSGLDILLVDDEPDARQVAQVALTSLGAHVTVASSGAEVLQRLEAARFDVLVSDIGMPEMDGLTLIREVRKLPRGGLADLPAIALTAFAMESDRIAGLAAGFQAYVAKPISLRRLSESIVQARRAAAGAGEVVRR